MARRLLLLNGLAILCVILFHATGFGFTAMFAWAHRYRDVTSPNYDAAGTAAYYALRLVEQFVTFCIPAFLFVSGYFVSVLAGRSHRIMDPRAIGARIRGLLIPYLIWSAVVLLGLALQGRVFSGARYLSLLATGATNPTYYYVPLLVQLYLVAPLVVLFANWRWKALLATTAALQVCVYALQYVIVVRVVVPGLTSLAAALPKWLFLAHLFWFTFGVVGGFQQRTLRVVLERRKRVLASCLVGLFVLGVLEWELLLQWSGQPWIDNRPTLIDGLYSSAAILSFLAFENLKIPLANSLVALGAKSYGIYLVHGLVMEYFSRGLYHLAPWILGWQILFQPMLIGVGLSVPLLLMSLVSRLGSPGLYRHLFG